MTRYVATPLLAHRVATILASVAYRANNAVDDSSSFCDGKSADTRSHQSDEPSAKAMQSGTNTHPSTPIASNPWVRNSSVSDRDGGMDRADLSDMVSPVVSRAARVIAAERLVSTLLSIALGSAVVAAVVAVLVFSTNVTIGATNEKAKTAQAIHGAIPSSISTHFGQKVEARAANHATQHEYSPAYKFITESSMTPLRGRDDTIYPVCSWNRVAANEEKPSIMDNICQF
mmetsp:Transcript_36800/g.66164  ORF Transcript_36800/g.66164 Transcript_36800/m.66164 type:complete len:230 (-) Transcript_36800:124-813(-)